MRDEVLNFLHELGINYDLVEHDAVFTCEESEKLKPKFESVNMKTLFLKNKAKDKFYMLLVPGSKRTDLKKLRKDLAESKLSFVSEEMLFEILGVRPGSVTPLALYVANKSDFKAIEVLIDKEILDGNKIIFHPLINTETVEMSTEDFEFFLEKMGYLWSEYKF